MKKFQPLSLEDLIAILGLTIKHDEVNKVITLLCLLTAYSDNAQFNISYNAPSSTGKSYIPTELARLFPAQDIIEIGYCSPTAFFHDVGEFDKEKGGYIADLSKKGLIFLDQPHTQLLERLRPLLSHDKKEIRLKITDKNQKHGLRTKNIILIGYPAVIFCTAKLEIDEQEATRLFLLSPEINQEKIREAIEQKISKEADNASFKQRLDDNPARQQIKERILAIKAEQITEIKIGNPKLIQQRFLSQNKALKPRHQRDIGRLLALVKSLALLNLWWRERQDSTIIANDDDIDGAFQLWDQVSVSQDLNLPPYIYKLYQEVILPAWDDRVKELNGDTADHGLSRQDISQKHFAVYDRMVDSTQLRQQILPMLETAGLITQEPAPSDKRKLLVYPVLLKTSNGQNNSGNKGGVKDGKSKTWDQIVDEIPY